MAIEPGRHRAVPKEVREKKKRRFGLFPIDKEGNVSVTPLDEWIITLKRVNGEETREFPIGLRVGSEAALEQSIRINRSTRNLPEDEWEFVGMRKRKLFYKPAELPKNVTPLGRKPYDS